MTKRHLFAALAAGATAAVALAGPAAATTTPLGEVSATWSSPACTDFGARVTVTVADGTPGATVTVNSLRATWSTTITLDAAGAGAGVLYGVINDDYAGAGNFTGTATIIATSAGLTGTTQVYVDCPGGKGD